MMYNKFKISVELMDLRSLKFNCKNCIAKSIKCIR